MTTFFPALFFALTNSDAWIISPLNSSCVYREDVSFELYSPSSGPTYLPFKMGDVGIYSLPRGHDNVGGVKDSHCSVGSTATNDNVPLPFLPLSHLLYKSRSPDIQLQGLGIEFQPISKLGDGIGHNTPIEQEANVPWELAYKPASMTGMANTEDGCALFTRFY